MTTKTKPVPTALKLGGGEHFGKYYIACEYDGACYHLWLKRETFVPEDNVLYKNPKVGRDHPDHFRTRHLEQNAGVGALIVPFMLAAAKALKPARDAELALLEAHNDADNEDYRRGEAIKKAAPDLLAAAKMFFRGMGTGFCASAEAQAALRAAVAKAETL